MNDFLGRLAQRALGPAPSVRPRLASLFVPLAGVASFSSQEPVAGAAEGTEKEYPAESWPLRAPRNGEQETSPRRRKPDPPPATTSVSVEIKMASVADAPPAPNLNPPCETDSLIVAPTAAGKMVNAPAQSPAVRRPLPSEASSLPTTGLASQHDTDPSLRSSVGALGNACVAPPHEAGSPPPEDEGCERPTRESAPPGRKDSARAMIPKPVEIPPPFESRVIRPEVRLPSVRTIAGDDARRYRDLSTPVSAAAPDVHITIGRVEVRATLPPAKPPSMGQSVPRLSLDEYLKRTAGGAR